MFLSNLVQLGVYIYYGATLGEWLSYSPDLLQSPLIFDPNKRQEVWRFLTYMLLHAGLVTRNSAAFLFNLTVSKIKRWMNAIHSNGV